MIYYCILNIQLPIVITFSKFSTYRLPIKLNKNIYYSDIIPLRFAEIRIKKFFPFVHRLIDPVQLQIIQLERKRSEVST